MAILQKMRTGWVGVLITVLIALSLLYFIAPMDDLLTLFGRPQNVGEIAGKGVSYEDFQEQVDKYTTINEIVTGSSVQNDQTHQQIRNAAWQEFIDKYMFLKNAKAAGITVGEQELLDLTSGEGVSPVIAQNPAFQDESGNFSVDALSAFVQQVGQDQTGRLKTYWNYLQNSIYNQQFYSKYSALFTNGGAMSKLMEECALAENNTTADIDYVMVPFGYEVDSTINVSASEIKKYYNNHLKNYKQVASRDIEYVVFEVTPSTSDIEAVADDMENLRGEFEATDNLKNFLLKNSDRSLSGYWYKADELKTINSDVDAFVFSNAAGTSPVYKDGNTFYAVRIVDAKPVADSVYVKHMLFQGADAAAKADSLLEVVSKNIKNFNTLAAEYSADKGSAADGELGNIGWLTQTYMIPGFESALTAKIGQPYVQKTQYGTHIILVSKTTMPVVKKQVAILEKTVLPSKETMNDKYAEANRFASIAGGKYEGYKAAIDSTHAYSHPMNRVLESTSSYGSIDQAKEVTRWIFDNKPGKASNIITVNNNYFFIVALKDVHKEGYAPVAEVSSRIKDILYNEKLQEKKAAEVAEKVAGMTDLQAIAEALNATVVSREDVAFSSNNGPMVEPALLGAVAAAEQGKLCGPVAGQMGVYMFTVKNRETGSFYTAEDARNFEAQKTQYSMQMLLPAMMENADVKDNRARYY